MVFITEKVILVVLFRNIKDEFVDVDLHIEGSTPEEAVANLWLELNKK